MQKKDIVPSLEVEKHGVLIIAMVCKKHLCECNSNNSNCFEYSHYQIKYQHISKTLHASQLNHITCLHKMSRSTCKKFYY